MIVLAQAVAVRLRKSLHTRPWPWHGWWKDLDPGSWDCWVSCDLLLIVGLSDPPPPTP